MNDLEINNKVSRHDCLAICHLEDDMTTKNMKAYIFSILKYDSATKTSSFTLNELEKWTNSEYRHKEILSIISKNRKLGLTIYSKEFEEKLIEKGLVKGKAMSLNLITNIIYENGVFTVYWWEKIAAVLFGEGGNYTVIDYLIASQLDKNSFTLYEYLLMNTKEGKTTVSMTMDEVIDILNLPNKTYKQYKFLSAYVLKKVKKALQENSDIILGYDPVRIGRSTVGVNFTISKNPDFEGHITEKQITTLSSMKVEQEYLLEHAQTEEERILYEDNLARLKNIPMLTKKQAGVIIDTIIERRKKINFLAKGLEEQEKRLSRERGRYDGLLENYFPTPIPKNFVHEFENVMYYFEESIRDEICRLALDYVGVSKGSTVHISYLVAIVKRWKEEKLGTISAIEQYQRERFPVASFDVEMSKQPSLGFSDDFLEAMNLWRD